jgi:hypothetical protein
MFLNATAFNQSLATWNMSSVVNAVNMLNGCAMSTANYDATLIGWAGQTLQTGVALGATGRTYCSAVTARATLTGVPKNWVITGDALLCPALSAAKPTPGKLTSDNRPVTMSSIATVEAFDRNNDLKVYPNPFESTFNLDLGGEKATHVSVQDAVGRSVYEINTSFGDNRLQLDLTNQASGVYIVEITTDKGVVMKRRVVKR